MAKGEGKLRNSLSARLLLLTVCFVMVVEIFVYVPSVAQFRRSFLEQRLTAAQIAVLALVEAPGQAISSDLERTLLRTAGIKAVSLKIDDNQQLMLRGDMPTQIDAYYDVRRMGVHDQIADALATLMRRGKGTIQVSGAPANLRGMEIDIILEEDRLFSAMMIYSRNVMLLSILISIFTASLVYFSLNWLLVRPMRRITQSMVSFRRRPDNPERSIVPSTRQDEVGIAERELARMQEDLRHALNQQRRLASLGAAVSKVNHDLRNILATAQLSSDRLLLVDDPAVRDMSGRLISAIDRAILLCERTLKYGRADEAIPEKRLFCLRGLMEDVAGSLGLDTPESTVRLDYDIPDGFQIYADPDQMFRVMLNLCRNALSALGGLNAHGGMIRVSATAQNGDSVLRIADNGPGLPLKTQENLFVPFLGSTGGHGTGLGLAIVAELITLNGGQVKLERTGPTGTVFCITLPGEKGA